MPQGIWEEPRPDASEEERIARLERVTQGYHDIVGEGGLLAGAVGNLDHSAGAIATVLQQVESNQRQLMTVQREGQHTRGMVVDMKADVTREKRRTRLVGFVVAAVIFLVALVASAGIFTYVKAVADADARYQQVSHDICLKRSGQATIIQRYLDGQVKQIRAMKLTPTQRDLYLKETAELRSAFPIVDCSRLVNP